MMDRKPKNGSRSADNQYGSSIKNRIDNSLIVYLKEISKLKLLKKEEEHILGENIQKGDKESLDELVKRNLKFVVKIASAFKRCRLSLLDLIEEGNIGLIKAAYRFDPLRDIKFITYANWWIRQAIMHAIAEQSGVVKLPVKQASILHKINSKHKALIQEYKRAFSSDELGKEVGISPQKTESILRAYRTHLSLNAPLKNNAETNYIDLLKSEDVDSIEESLFIDTLKSKIKEALKELSPREEKVLRHRFGIDKTDSLTLKEIGEKMNLSRERVRQIEKKATERLRSRNKIKILKEFLN
jgi:RNA polymerase primary sigma factor